MKDIRRYTVTLTTLGPLHVGGLDDPLGSADENPVAVIGGRACIPGPTLKGALRAEIERFLIATGETALRPCLTTTQPSEAEKSLTEGEREFFLPRPCALAVRGSGNGSDRGICPACYLLGAQGLVGFVSVPFLMADNSVKPEVLYASRLDRATGTVVGGNRSYQVIPPGVRFTGRMDVLFDDKVLGWSFGKKRPIRSRDGTDLDVDDWIDNSNVLGSDPDKLLEQLVLERLTSIDLIGGYRSKGFGAVEVEVAPA